MRQPESRETAPDSQRAASSEALSVSADRLAENASKHFLVENRSCSESLLMAGCETLGIQSALIPDIAIGLAGGIGTQGDVCGVLTGATMALSLAVAREEPEYLKKKARTIQAVGRLYNDFKKQLGCTDCRTLCGQDLTTEEGRKNLAAGIRTQKCAKFVEVGARFLAREFAAVSAGA